MRIIPAIDIRGVRCVRLEQGDYARETIFDEDPVAVAGRWQAAGARRLHVVDLDGARDGQPRNEATVQAILGASNVPVQVGGGIRDIAAAQSYLDAAAVRTQPPCTTGVARIHTRLACPDALARRRWPVLDRGLASARCMASRSRDYRQGAVYG